MFSDHPVNIGNISSLTVKLYKSLEKYIYLFVITSDMDFPPEYKLYKNRNQENKPLVDYGAWKLKGINRVCPNQSSRRSSVWDSLKVRDPKVRHLNSSYQGCPSISYLYCAPEGLSRAHRDSEVN